MTFRYNPQSIEKQVRKWPVFFSEKELHIDLARRLEQIIGTVPLGWYDPFSLSFPYEKDLIYEYGTDVCRLALINSNYSNYSENLLEPSFKWLAKFHEVYNTKSDKITFNPVPWLEALIQLEDHILKRNADRLALALVMKAFKESPPTNLVSPQESLLIGSCLLPFVPVYSAYTFPNILKLDSIKKIIESFNDYRCVKIALEKGGWHWHVFSRKKYESQPLIELSKIKWIKKAISGKNIKLQNEAGGTRICFS